MAIVSRSVSMAMPPKPRRRSVFRPAFSTRTNDTMVMRTLIAPIPIVAKVALSSLRPDCWKMDVEKKMTYKVGIVYHERVLFLCTYSVNAA